MKYIFIAMCLISFSGYAQEILQFERVINIENKNKSELFASINEWFAVTYNSANDVIQMADKEFGKIIGKGIVDCIIGNNSSYNGTLSYTIKVAIKDNKYRVTIQNITHKGKGISLGSITNAEIYSSKGMYKNANNKAWNDIKVLIEDFSNDIFNDLNTHINKNNDNSDDW